MTLTGPAGTGKTRLAIAAATEVVNAFANGVVFVDLAPLNEPGLVITSVAEVLGVPASLEPNGAGGLARSLTGKQLLLVLDNLERLAAAGPHLADLLAFCPHLKILATSRAPLRLRWEHEFAVSPLALPDPRSLPAPDELATVPAVALFVERARAIRPDFVLSAKNAPAVAEICVQLDGLPLAIELAAARVRILPPALIQARLQRLDLLSAETKDRPPRHQTLRRAIDWSYELLPTEAQILFERLAVFAGGWSLESAEDICGNDGIPRDAVLDLLEHLADQSMVLAEMTVESSVRYRMLETLRQYARERLEADEQAERVSRWHSEYFAKLAERADLELLGPRATTWLSRLEPDRENLRSALEWALEHGETSWSLRLGSVLWQVIEYALTTESEQVIQPPVAQIPDGSIAPLTERQAEVAVLIAQGRTNRQIAEQLVITEATAERHVANILNKLDLHTRSQLAVWAVGHGLPVNRLA
jgi:non-specific serine/threonine protein kinase